MKSKYPFTNDSSLMWTSGSALPDGCVYGARLVLPPDTELPVRLSEVIVKEYPIDDNSVTVLLKLIDAVDSFAGYVIFTTSPTFSWMGVCAADLRTGYVIDKNNDYGGSMRGSAQFANILKSSIPGELTTDAFTLAADCVFLKNDAGFLGYTSNIVFSDPAVKHSGSTMTVDTTGKNKSIAPLKPVKQIWELAVSQPMDLAIIHNTFSGLKVITQSDKIWIGRAGDVQ